MRRAGIFLAAYLVLFGGFQVWKVLHRQQAEYAALVAEAKVWRAKMIAYRDRADVVQRMMDDLHLDPAKLSRATIVGEASSAIQKAATASGIQVGTIRESASHGTGDEVASMQFEGSGPVAAVTGLLNRMQALGYPLIIDSVQLTTGNGPGMIKVSLTIVILDFEKWKNPEAAHA